MLQKRVIEDYGQGFCSILLHRMRTLCVPFDRKVVHIAYPVVQAYAVVVSEPSEASEWNSRGRKWEFAESESESELKQQLEHNVEKREHE